jgi:hypothetical protein
MPRQPLPQPPSNLKAIDIRQANIQNDNIRQAVMALSDSFFPVINCEDIVALDTEIGI